MRHIMKKVNKYIIIVFLAIIGLNSFGQVNILTDGNSTPSTLSTGTVGTPIIPPIAPGNYVGVQSVDAQYISNIDPTAGQQVHLFIDKSIPQPITGDNGGNNYSPTNPLPTGPITYTINPSAPVGKTSTSYGVTPTGGATYSVPIMVPPGTMNMAPQLSVDYNSQSPSGLLGLGWNLNGLHSISRMGKTIYHNGYVSQINMDNSDWFALDGNKLVVNTGTNGADGAVYSTEMETFSSITSHGGSSTTGPQWFSVQTKDGMTMEFGNTADSKLIPTGQTNPIMQWMVNKVYDEHGNYISFQYENQNGEIFIKEIDYTGNDNAGITPYNNVLFTYGLKTDANTTYCAQGKYNSTVVLTSIEVVCQGNLFKKYSFNYNFSNVYSYLTEIDEEGADKAILKPLQFSYTADLSGDNGVGTTATNFPDAPLEASLSTSSSYPFPFRKFALLDYNGDGKEDIIDFQGSYTDVPPTTFYSNLQWALGTTLSFNWNIPVLLQNTTSTIATVHSYTATTFTTVTSASMPAWDPSKSSLLSNLPLNNTSAGDLGQLQMDFNGDGREDLASSVITYNPGVEDADYEEDISIGLSTSGSTSTNPPFTTPSGKLITYGTNPTSPPVDGVNYYNGSGQTFYLDLNGDNQMDVINYHLDQTGGIEHYRIWLNAGANNPSLSSAPTTVPNFEITVNAGFTYGIFNIVQLDYLDFSQAFPMDIDGDGKYELVNVVQRYGDGTFQKVIVKFDFTQTYNQPNYLASVNGGYGEVATPGNGIVIEPDNSSFNYYLNSFTTTVNVEANPQYSTTLTNNDHYSLFGDFNGDGISDVLYYTGSSWSMNFGTGGGYYATSSVNGLTNDNPFSYPTVWYYAEDVNGDGKTDIIEFTNAAGGGVTVINVYYSTGNSFVPGFVTAYGSTLDPQRDQISFGDFNGDGINDLFIADEFTNPSQPAIIYFNQGGFSKYLEDAVDGYGTSTQFTYQPLTQPGTSAAYTQNSTTSYRNGILNTTLLDINKPLYVVTQHNVPNGIGGLNTTTYSYQDAIQNNQGKGLLGFLSVSAYNTMSDYSTTINYSYNTTFFNPTTFTSSTIVAKNSDAVAQTDSTIADISLGSITGFPFQRYYEQPTTAVYTDNVTGGVTTTSYNSYDGYGNILDKTTTNNAQTTEEANTYTQSGAWIPSRLATSKVTNTRTGQSAYARETDYDNYNSFGQPAKIVKDHGEAKELDNNYTYDPNSGVITKIQVSSSGLPTETTSYAYDAQDRFIVQSSNSLNQVSEKTYDPKWGMPLTETTIDNLKTTYTYDGYGRVASVITPDGLTTTVSYNWYTGGLPQSGDPSLIDVANNALYSTFQQKTGSPSLKTYYDIYGREIRKETDDFSNEVYSEKGYNTRGDDSVLTNTYEIVSGTNYVPVITTKTYDEFNRVTKSDSTDGISDLITTFAYTEASGNTTVTEIVPDGRHESQTIDMAGLVTQDVDFQGNIVSKTYGSFNKVTATSLTTSTSSVQLNSALYDIYGMPYNMTDNNSGTLVCDYNAYGQLDAQTDANGSTYTMTYDALNRMTSKVGPEGTYSYQYITSGNGLDMLQTASSPYNTSCTYTYDNLRRTTQKSENINGTVLNTQYQYDIYGHVTQQTYPGGFAIQNIYTSNGYLYKTNRVDNGNLIWWGLHMNPFGQYDDYALGNALVGTKTFTNFGLPTQFKVSDNIQNLTFDCNPLNGNLNKRTEADVVAQNQETFTYDNMDRLLSSVASLTSYPYTAQPIINITYQPNGNINSKSDIDQSYNYQYNTTRQNAVTKVGNANGLINSNQQDITYTPFSQPSVITQGTQELDITYGPMHDRKEEDLYCSSVEMSSRYFTDGFERNIDHSTNVTTEVNYISCAGNLVAMCVGHAGALTMYYPHSDPLGSILTVTDENDDIVAEQSFDAWGNYRNPTDWSYTSIPTQPDWLYRGFTEQEHLSEFGLVNLNARLYDPLIGRMLSPDAYIQNSDFSQNYNRYSYCINNPLKYIDPTGNSSFWQWAFGRNSFINVGGTWVWQNIVVAPLKTDAAGFVSFWNFVKPVVLPYFRFIAKVVVVVLPFAVIGVGLVFLPGLTGLVVGGWILTDVINAQGNPGYFSRTGFVVDYANYVHSSFAWINSW